MTIAAVEMGVERPPRKADLGGTEANGLGATILFTRGMLGYVGRDVTNPNSFENKSQASEVSRSW